MLEENNVHEENEKLPEQTENTDVEETTEDSQADVSLEDEGKEEIEEKTDVEERKVFTMSVSKAQKEKKRAVEKAREEVRAEYEAKLAELQNKSANDVEVSDELSTFAEEQGVDKEIIKKIVDLAQKPFSEKLSKVDGIIAEKEKIAEFAKVEKEFDEKVSDLIKKDYPNAPIEHINKIKKEVTELAFTKDFNTYKLEDIYKVNRDSFEYKDNYGIEPSSSTSVDVIDFDNISDEDQHKLAQENPQKFAEFLKYQDAKHSTLVDM